MDPKGGECIAKDEATNDKVATQNIAKVFKTHFDAKYNIVDIETPLNAFMSGQFKRSYAYYTLQNQLPVVLTKVLDSITRDKSELVAQFGENARKELKIVIGLISRLKYEMQTDKPFQMFTGDEPDRDSWNNFISLLPNEGRTFYRGCWMHAQCYVYRKLYSFVENSIFLKPFDYFGKIKEHALTSCQEEILALASYTRRTESTVDMFGELLKIALWSNRNDLSSNNNGRQFNMKVLENVCATDDYTLINNTAEIWKCLSNKNTDRQHVDFVVDNVGYELFTDFILAEYIIEKGLATKVRFHVKAHPWFVTGVTQLDFHKTLDYLSKHSDYIISLIGNKFLQFLSDGLFEVAPVSYFWTGPHAFHCMRSIDPDLYKMLQLSKLVIFKGDLNYRRLLDDVCWDPTQDIRMCLGGFLPSNLCIVRIIKAEVICGLSEAVIKKLKMRDPNWMVTANYGLIQFVDGSREFGY